jgi:hypothetical protein
MKIARNIDWSISGKILYALMPPGTVIQKEMKAAMGEAMRIYRSIPDEWMVRGVDRQIRGDMKR